MIKSLYVRVVLSYMIAVVIGLAATFYLATLMVSTVGDKFAERLQNELVKDVDTIGVLLRERGMKGAKDELKERRLSDKYDVMLYDGSGKLMTEDGAKASELYLVPDQIVRSVLQGETYRRIGRVSDRIDRRRALRGSGGALRLVRPGVGEKVTSFILSLLLVFSPSI